MSDTVFLFPPLPLFCKEGGAWGGETGRGERKEIFWDYKIQSSKKEGGRSRNANQASLLLRVSSGFMGAKKGKNI